MKKIAMLLALALAVGCVLGGCAKTEAPAANVANPMVESDADTILQELGFTFGVPEGAEEVKYFIIDKALAEMQFTLDGVKYNARIQSAAEFTDISGVHGEPLAEESANLFDGRGDTLVRRYKDAERNLTTDVMLWFDVVPGVQYCLTAEAADLDGFDIQAIAEVVFIPTQGEVG